MTLITLGFDFEVIKIFDFNKYFPKLINYENKHLSSVEQAECEDFLREKGYEVLKYGGNTCAIHCGELIISRCK